MDRRYFDWAATALPLHLPADPQSPHAIPFANPSSPHADGRAAFEALERARLRCASVLGASSERIVFVSGGTEANNLPLQALLFTTGSERGLLFSAVEHPSVSEPAGRLKRLGIPTTALRPDADGRISPEAVARGLDAFVHCRMVAVMAVNNETGAINDIRAIVEAVRRSQRARRRRIAFHCDAVQAVGKIPIDLDDWDIDTASMSAHKIGGPRGIGILYSRGTFQAVYAGGGQERGLRAGTQNTHGAVGFSQALEIVAPNRDTVEANQKAAAARMAHLIAGIKSIRGGRPVPETRSEEDPRYSPYILQAAFAGIPGEVLARVLDDAGISISTGSACSSGSGKRPVLEAMGVDPNTAIEAVRISQGYSTTDEDIEALLDALSSCIGKLR